MKRNPEDIITEAVSRAELIFKSQIHVEVDEDSSRMQFLIQWAGTAMQGKTLLYEFDRWWNFYCADVLASFHLEFTTLTPASPESHKIDELDAARSNKTEDK